MGKRAERRAKWAETTAKEEHERWERKFNQTEQERMKWVQEFKRDTGREPSVIEYFTYLRLMYPESEVMEKINALRREGNIEGSGHG